MTIFWYISTNETSIGQSSKNETNYGYRSKTEKISKPSIILEKFPNLGYTKLYCRAKYLANSQYWYAGRVSRKFKIWVVSEQIQACEQIHMINKIYWGGLYIWLYKTFFFYLVLYAVFISLFDWYIFNIL